MIQIYGECRKNASEAYRVYAERYPDRRQPSRRLFGKLFIKLRDSGSVTPRARVRNKPTTGEAGATNVLAAVAVNPHVSSREIARDAGMSQRSVLRILHTHKFHPYHISLHQELHGNDFVDRVRFCTWMLRHDTPDLSRILFTDEATFTNHGNVNLRNMHYWSVTNPHWLRQVERQRPWSVNVWCGIVGEHLIGPFFIQGTLNADRYIQFLQHELPVLLEDIPLQTRREMWYQHDGCPAHSARRATACVENTFPNRWIGRGGPVKWPARSPDFSPLDFFLWGKLKDIVYRDVPTTPEDMQHRITAACRDIPYEMLHSVQRSLRGRLVACIAADGHHFEHTL